jgi:DNA-directed RNA polymerase subunit beta'
MKISNFDYLQLQIASPEDILSWSRGEVKKAETINYRTHRAEPEGLMCEKIFGPSKDYECYCGKYKKYKYKGIVCDKCGVEVTKRSVRRERMGHIRLASPVTHVWYAHGLPNKLAIILEIPQKKLQSVIYFSRYLVVECDPDGKVIAQEQLDSTIKERFATLDSDIETQIAEEEKALAENIKNLKSGKSKESADELELEVENLEHKNRQKIAKIKEEGAKKKNEVESEMSVLKELIARINVGETLTEEEWVLLAENEISFFSLKMGAEAIQYLLQKMDLETLAEQLHLDLKSTNLQKRLKATARLRLVNGMIQNSTRPEWMVLDVISVIPPELRPIVQISGGRFATADLNDLYRRVINRNNRLKRLMELGAPDVIVRNEKRMLQEAVDALLDNEHRLGQPVTNKRKVPLKSLSATLRGKQGRFRQNLLGKRVDYSGRAVIVTAGRDLRINQVGLPKQMALELFKPFVVNQLIERGFAANARSAKFMIEDREKAEDVWNILEEVINGHPVMINRAPTLHKQSIQAFYPVLVEGDALRIHPMICEGFNADFDGDQMAVHVPLTKEAIEEAIAVMMPKTNMLKATSGEFILNPNKDLVQAIYYLTTIKANANRKSPLYFVDSNHAEQAFQTKKVELRETIKLLLNDEIIETSVGRIIFNQMLPESFGFINKPLNKNGVQQIALEVFKKYDADQVIDTLDNINNIGFKYSTASGFSVGLSDLVQIPDLQERMDAAMKKTEEIEQYFRMGLLTQQDKTDQFQKLWTDEVVPEIERLTRENLPEGNSLRDIADSKSRYSYDVINQVIGVKGPVIDATLKVVELPIASNYLNGFSSFEYFISAKGARKGLADTALRTADSGYLTRKLCEVSQDCLIRDEDCGTDEGIIMDSEDDKTRTIPFQNRLIGRTVAKDVLDKKGKVIVPAGQLLSADDAAAIVAEGFTKLEIRSPLTCKTRFGVCQKCYGLDYSTNQPVEIGKAVGILAAQSLGEPATQLVLRTFYKSGAASAGADITQGMPRLQELFEARIPKGQAVISEIPGKVEITEDGKGNYIVAVKSLVADVLDVAYAAEDKLAVKPTTKKIKAGELLFTKANGEEITSSRNGKLTIKPDRLLIESQITEEVEYKVSTEQELLVGEGDSIEAGTLITGGSVDPRQLLQAKGMSEAQRYIINEIQKVYQSQGIQLGDKHIEIIATQMGRYSKVERPGESGIIVGEVKDKYVIAEINDKLIAEGKEPIKASPLLLGITLAALKTESFLSAASFQEQVRVLSDAALTGKQDFLRGLKENVIIGKMIPTGARAKLKPGEVVVEVTENEAEILQEEVKPEIVE